MSNAFFSWNRETRWFDSFVSSCNRRSKPQNTHLTQTAVMLVAVLVGVMTVSGCGGIVPNTSSSGNATTSTGDVVASPTSVEFGTVDVGNSSNQQVVVTNQGTQAVQISKLTLSDSSFSIDGQGNLPLSVAAGSTVNLKVHFNPQSGDDTSGQLTISSNSAFTPTANVKLHGKGSKPAGSSGPTLSSLSCTSASMTGAGTDACTVTLTGAAGTGGMNVSLSSNNNAVTVPGTVSVPNNATTASFTATILPVTTAQTLTLTASSGGTSKSFSLQLNPAANSGSGGSGTGTPTLSVSATSVSFGSVVINTPTTQSVVLKSTGTATVTVSSATATGTGFSVSGGTFPATLTPGQSVTLNVQFDPTTAGAANGQLTIQSNSSGSASATVSLSGTGAPHEVALAWNAPGSSSDPVAGYNIYRAPSGTGSYQLINSSADTQSTYTDNTVQSGQKYDYVVKSLDSAGSESAASNTATVSVP